MRTVAKPCLVCGRLTSGGSYCDDHARQREAKRNRSPAQRARLSITREQRRRVYARDGYRCVDCGARADLTLDHVTPLAAMVRPSYRDDELQTLCRSCNSRRGGSVRTPAPAVRRDSRRCPSR